MHEGPTLHQRSQFLRYCLAICFTALGACQTRCEDVSREHPERIRRGMELFRTQVRGVLTKHCAECHGVSETEGGLNLLSRKSLLQGGVSGPAVVLEKPDDSLLLRLVSHKAKPFMPLDQERLDDNAIAAIRKWIENEAPYDRSLVEGATAGTVGRVVTEKDREFWSFRPLQQVTLPNAASNRASENPIDRFMDAKLAEQKLTRTSEANRETLIRRLAFDLVGLPPAPEEIDAFLADTRPDAWERLIDRFLASPHFGERWARHWLDVARFAESYGFENDLDNDHAYHFRDFVIHALNSNMPFDQFVRWQLAGDELAPDEPLARMATGFLAAGVRNADIAQVGVEAERYDELDDLAVTVGNAMLGFSVGCARCHDHQSDPITQEDYYRFVATFERTIRGEVELAVPTAGGAITKVLVAGEGLEPLARIYSPRPTTTPNTCPGNT